MTACALGVEGWPTGSEAVGLQVGELGRLLADPLPSTLTYDPSTDLSPPTNNINPISSNGEPSTSPPQVVTATAPVDRTLASNLPPAHTKDGTGQQMARGAEGSAQVRISS